MYAVKRALGFALNERAEEPLVRAASRASFLTNSRVHAGSGVNFLPSMLGDDEENLQVDNYNDVAGDTIATTAAVPTAKNDQQSSRYHRQGTTPPGCLPGVSTLGSQLSCAGFQTERRTCSSARANSIERTEGITIDDHNGGQKGLNDTDARRDIAGAGEITVEAEGQRPSDEGAQELLQHEKPAPTEGQAAELSPRTARAKICNLGRDLSEARAIAIKSTECRRVAEARVVELEEVIAESERQHALLRARGESRLEVLKMALVQEQEEDGAQVRHPVVYT